MVFEDKMALLLSHRGNVDGIDEKRENSVAYVEEAMDKGYHVVVDTWLVGHQHLVLGTTSPKYPTTLEFLQDVRVLCNAKNQETLQFLLENKVHCFSRGSSPYTLTSGGLIWAEPGTPVCLRGIFTMPEHCMKDITTVSGMPCSGICSNQVSLLSKARATQV